MRSSVALTLLSELLPAEAISSIVGTEPDFSLGTGAAGHTRWELHSTAAEDAGIHEHVNSVIERIKPLAERIRGGRSAIDTCCIDISIYLEPGDAVPSILITAEQMNFLAKLGIDLDIDVYPAAADTPFVDSAPAADDFAIS